jgi:hypothetical protein
MGAPYIYDISHLRVKQVINLRICCILLVDSVESMMMHGLANPKQILSSSSMFQIHSLVAQRAKRALFYKGHPTFIAHDIVTFITALFVALLLLVFGSVH